MLLVSTNGKAGYFLLSFFSLCQWYVGTNAKWSTGISFERALTSYWFSSTSNLLVVLLKKLMHERVKWIKIARGRFSSAAGKEQKMRSLKALEAREERGVGWRDRGKGRQWKDPCRNEEHGWRRVGSTGSWSGWAAGRIQSWWKGKLEQLLLDQITTLGKQRAKCYT